VVRVFPSGGMGVSSGGILAPTGRYQGFPLRWHGCVIGGILASAAELSGGSDSGDGGRSSGVFSDSGGGGCRRCEWRFAHGTRVWYARFTCVWFARFDVWVGGVGGAGGRPGGTSHPPRLRRGPRARSHSHQLLYGLCLLYSPAPTVLLRHVSRRRGM
jgi:hypothetical protein